MIGESYNLITFDSRKKEKIDVDTFIFQTFFWMTMFNQINSRVIDGDMNVFKSPFSSLWFWIIWIAEVGVMVMMQLWS